MKKKILSIFLVGFMMFAFVSSNQNKDIKAIKDSNDEELIESYKLDILKSDLKLTQDQVMSQIKAEHLIKNEGYTDDDEIDVVLTLKNNSLIDSFNVNYYFVVDTVKDYANSEVGKNQINEINKEQELVINELYKSNLITSVEAKYNTILNGIAVKTTYGNFKKISKLDYISSSIICDTYNLPKAESSNTSAIVNAVDIYSTGIFDSSCVSYKGDGTVVAVLDSGFDCSHTVFNGQPEKTVLTQQNLSLILDKTNAKQTTKSLCLSDVYYSKKIPFVYDYADKDTNVFPYDSEHGTHVAGIIGGCDDVITGVAVNTQLVLMKVFPDLDAGGKTNDILCALEDAVLLGVDCINMSLGSSCGFARAADSEKINEVYDKINDAGISLITAASNSYSSAYGGKQGNTNKVTNPDSSTVGSPSTYKAALSVASISGTKSNYIVDETGYVFFFDESRSVAGKENNFFKELGVTEGVTKTFEYYTVPGSGIKGSYDKEKLTGKIALIRRGDNTFEEKALLAKQAGAIGCIIYNNIEGDILMNMGKTDHIPTISISKENGTYLANKGEGKLTIAYTNEAGPFMSDFSSWGPTPDLRLKPEITGHGGNIKSSIPGGGYDELSGTSMATPNLCGIVVLIRQYVKENFPGLTSKEVTNMVNQLLMSTATIALNEEGNPYSPRKQGAGLASLKKAVTTKAYITVDGNDKTKLELLDDPNRTGVYEMEFNVKNISNETLSYNMNLVGMTESISTSNKEFVAEKSQILNGNTKVELVNGGNLDGDKLTVNANETCKVKVTYTLTSADKKLIDSLFPYGMYVEGFVKLQSLNNGVDLNVPFLAFYGDWTEAPLFDKTYYEVETEAHDGSIDDDKKLKADYWATTPYGSYFYNYMIPLGTYLYDVDKNVYDEIPATEDHIAISNALGCIDGLSTVYAGLLRNAKTLTYTITEKETGNVIYTHVEENAVKAYGYNGSPIPHYDYLKLKSNELGLTNNRQYEFTMKALLDYGDGGEKKNVRNEFSFDFFLDDEAPILKEVTYEKVYDKTLKKDRYYVNMVVYDNQYTQAITPIIFTSSSSYTLLSDNPIPVYSERGKDAKVRFEITDYLDEIYHDGIITSSLAFSIDDYALNSNIYLCELPGTKGDFKFTKDGTTEGIDLIILSMYEDEVVDVTKYLATSDKSVDDSKSYLNHLVWSCSNELVAEVDKGLIKCKKPGRATVTVKEQMDLKQAVLIINVKERTENYNDNKNHVADASEAKVKDVKFTYFETLFAYSRAAQTSEIGNTGSKIFLSSLDKGLSFYPGEKIKLFYDFDPWYAKDNYELTYESTNSEVATVDQDGVVTGLKKGTTNIVLKVSNSNIIAKVKLTIKSPFVIENRVLIAYKGLGGDVVIPDDEGILYVGSYAFCLYETDRSMELSDDDYDANKIPAANTTITSVVIPDGVTEIQKYAFYNCSGLKSVTIPDTCKYVREYAFYGDSKLENINLDNIEVIGRSAFYNCKSLKEVNMPKIYAIGVSGFEKCTSLVSVDLTTLRNTGSNAFKDCTSLKTVKMNEHTQLAMAMFAQSGLESVDIYETLAIPTWCFAKCNNLKTVNIHKGLDFIGYGAFSECEKLESVNILDRCDLIDEQAFYSCSNLKTIKLPNSDVEIGNYSFFKCSNLEELIIDENTLIKNVLGSVFKETKLSKFTVNDKNTVYTVNGNYLVKDGNTIVFAKTLAEYNELTIDPIYNKIEKGAFSGCNITKLVITNKDLVVEDYAFSNCENLTEVTLPEEAGFVINKHVFNYASNLTKVNNLNLVKNIGEYAFANTKVDDVVLADDAILGEGVFFKSYIKTITVGKNDVFGLGVFQNCGELVTVNMPEEGNVHFGHACFANCVKLNVIDLSKTDNYIEDQTFYNCQNLTKAILTNVKLIGEYAFADCKRLSWIEMPMVEEIKQGAFAKYDSNVGGPIFSELVLPNTLKIIGEGVFTGCNGIMEVTIPQSIESIGDYVFAYCDNLTTVKLPNTLKKISKFAFAKDGKLSSINLNNVEVIDEYAFAYCENLKTINLANCTNVNDGAFAQSGVSAHIYSPKLTFVGDYAFQATNLLSIEASKLAHIGKFAFHNNYSIEQFILSKDIEYVGTAAFNGCTKISNFYYMNGNQKVSTFVINDYLTLNKGSIYVKLPNGGYELKAVPGGKTQDSLTVMEGTVRIDYYAGNANENIKMIILPDSLKVIGNYAFYGYTKLDCVEFKSFTAPRLEDVYVNNAHLSMDAPGYGLLQAYYDIFDLDSLYYTFKDLVGNNKAISMILPENPDVVGYDSIIYEAYFGKVADAQRSTYVAKADNLYSFVEYATKIMNIKTITLANENLINNALTIYNTIKQNPLDFGYSQKEWDEYVDSVNNAKEQIRLIKLSNASSKVQSIQDKINNLDPNFDINKLDSYSSLANEISSLQSKDKLMLDLTNYDKLVQSYKEYLNTLNEETNNITINVVNSKLVYVAITGANALALGVYVILRKRMFK